MEEAAQVVRWILERRRFGSIEVLEASADLDADVGGEPLMVFTLVLADPGPGLVTWPFDDRRELLLWVGEKAREVELDVSWYVETRAVSTVAAARVAGPDRAAG